MPGDLEQELYRQFKGAQEKYTYFLLAASASAIGYAITQIKVEPFNPSHIAFALSIVLWSLSFISGLRFIEGSTNFTFKNVIYLSFKRELKNSPNYAALVSKHKEDLWLESEKISKKMSLYSGLQNKFLLLGALSYISWHALIMLAIS